MRPTLLTSDAARKLRRDHYDNRRGYSNSRGTLARGVRRHQQGPLPAGHLQFYNNSSETVPRWGVMRIETQGSTARDGQVLVCNKPNSSYQALYVVNLESDVAPGFPGLCSFLTEASPLGMEGHYALYNTAATPAVGQSWGPVNDSWLLHQHGPGFGVLGSQVENESRVAVLQIPPAEILVKNAGSSIAAGSSGSVQVWGGVAGSEANSGLTVTAYNRTSVAFGNNKFGAVGFLNGQAYVVPFQT